MLRILPPTITADETPDWLPIGWVVHSTRLKSGRQTKTYTHLRTGKRLFTKDQVLEYIMMDTFLESKEDAIHRKKLKAFEARDVAREKPSWLPDDSKAEPGTGSYGGTPYTIHENISNVSSKVVEVTRKSGDKSEETPRKPQGEKGSSSVNIEEEPVEWPEPDPTFPFEPIRIFEYDDSVIRNYLEEYYAAAGSDHSNLPLPDFGLPSFSNIQISRDEEPECKKEKSLGPPPIRSVHESGNCTWEESTWKSEVFGASRRKKE